MTATGIPADTSPPEASNRDPMDVFIVKRPFLDVEKDKRITFKDVAGRCDPEHLIRNGTLVPMRASNHAMKGVQPTWSELLDEIEELSTELAEQRYRHAQERTKWDAERKLLEEKSGSTMTELLREMAKLRRENGELKAQIPMAVEGASEDSIPSYPTRRRAENLPPNPDTMPPESPVVNSGPVQPQPKPARTQGNRLKPDQPKPPEAL